MNCKDCEDPRFYPTACEACAREEAMSNTAKCKICKKPFNLPELSEHVPPNCPTCTKDLLKQDAGNEKAKRRIDHKREK